MMLCSNRSALTLNLVRRSGKSIVNAVYRVELVDDRIDMSCLGNW